MKTNIKFKLAATAAAVLATGLLSQNVKAGAVLGQQYDETLEEITPNTGEQGETFVVRSSAFASGVNGSGQTVYTYQYLIGGSTDANKPGPPVPLSVFGVYFDTLDTLATLDGSASASVPFKIQPVTAVNGELNWQFNPLSQVEVLSFTSTDLPGFGFATAQNGGTWDPDLNGNSAALQMDLTMGGMDPDSLLVVPIVPAVPDTATTLSLLGGALVGLGALRRKIGC